MEVKEIFGIGIVKCAIAQIYLSLGRYLKNKYVNEKEFYQIVLCIPDMPVCASGAWTDRAGIEA